ncbi:MAG: hypothetical protein LIO79_01905 [Rikenellaceae bacterium]|nr:hypothetical protein [Rikenellaceae bacterium]
MSFSGPLYNVATCILPSSRFEQVADLSYTSIIIKIEQAHNGIVDIHLR